MTIEEAEKAWKEAFNAKAEIGWEYRRLEKLCSAAFKVLRKLEKEKAKFS
jgi:hypothetical protein